MAKRKKAEAPSGAPAWMSTFSDLMNLLLCFFVLLFSMSTVDTEKFMQVIASIQSSVSILPSGGSSIGEGQLISSGVSQLEFLDSYYKDLANSKTDQDVEEEETGSFEEQYEQAALSESEEMAEEIENALEQLGVQDQVEVDFNAEYVRLSLNGAILFNSGKADILEEAHPIIDKIGKVLEGYPKNIIEIEGHTDNVPMSSGRYEDNDVLSMYRALSVANYIRKGTDLNPAYIKSSGRGEYVPIADNSTTEGRARNRRVEIKIYNSFNSNVE